MSGAPGNGDGLRLIVRLVTSRPRQVLTIGALAFLGALLAAPAPWLGKILIDDIIFKSGAGGGRHVSSLLGVSDSVWMLAGIVLLGVCLKLAGAITAGWHVHVTFRVARDTLHVLRMRTAARLMGAPQRHFETLDPGALAARFTHDIMRMDNTIVTLLRFTLGSFFTLALAAAFMLAMNPLLTAFVLATLPLTVVLYVRSYNRLRVFSQEESDRWAALGSACVEVFGAVRLVRVFNAEAAFLRRIERPSGELCREGIKYWTVMHTLSGLLGLMSSVGADIFLFACGILALQGRITFGEIFAFSAYQAMLWGPINQLLNSGQTAQEGVGCADKVSALLKTEQEPYLERPRKGMPEFRGAVRAEKLGFSYDGVEEVLRDVDLVVEPGTMTALVGPSGSGKTTFADLLLGLYLPTRGRLLVDGVDIRDWDLAELRSRTGVVLQDTTVFDDTIRGNLLLGGGDAPDERLWTALRAANLDDTVRALPEGLDTPVGQRGARLSGGQRQRLAIARVFLRDPRLVILDEATSALDNETERRIRQGFDALLEGRTSLVIAHRLSTVQRAHRIVVLRRGQVVETGSHAELLERPDGVYRQMYQAQVDGLLPMSGPRRRPWAATKQT